MANIRKVVITAFGDESVLAVQDAQIADPKPGEVQIRVKYSVVSGSDVNMRRGTYPLQRKAPLTPGYSILGSVSTNGKGAGAFQQGDRVVALTKYDGQAELINVPERFLVHVPAEVDEQQAVALVLDWVTAYELLHRSAKAKAGQRIFVHGLSGAVGGSIMQLALLNGIEVFGTAGPGKLDALQEAGASAFDYCNRDWIEEVRSRGGVDAVFDPLGYESFDDSFRILRRGGILVGYGMNLPALTKTKRRASLPVFLKLFARNLTFWTGKRTTFFGLNRRSAHYKPDLELLLRWLAEGKVQVPIKAVYPMDKVQDAHREYSSGRGRGSIILSIPSIAR